MYPKFATATDCLGDKGQATHSPVSASAELPRGKVLDPLLLPFGPRILLAGVLRTLRYNPCNSGSCHVNLDLGSNLQLHRRPFPKAHDRAVKTAAGHDTIPRFQAGEQFLKLLALLRLRPQNQEIPDGEKRSAKDKKRGKAAR